MLSIKRVIGIIVCVAISYISFGQKGAGDIMDAPNGNNVFIITLDGLRWQELFKGADKAILNDTFFTKNPTVTNKNFWVGDLQKRRNMLMPFMWNVVAEKGVIIGNRDHGSKVNTKNLYSISYPGYNEIFTGYADPFVSTNKKKKNKHITLLEYLNNIPPYNGSIAAYTSWDVFPYILNEERSNIYINSGYQAYNGNKLSHNQVYLNKINNKAEYANEPERYDMLTFLMAKEFIVKNKPKIFYLGLGGTDSYGHLKDYNGYLIQAQLADKIISDLWYLIQSMPFYKNKTTFIITTDHGRGKKPGTWYKHGFFVNGASQAWIAMIGSGINAIGEHKEKKQFLLTQLAGTIGLLTGVTSYNKKTLPANFFTNPATYVVKK